jgi:hypothetical protein
MAWETLQIRELKYSKGNKNPYGLPFCRKLYIDRRKVGSDDSPLNIVTEFRGESAAQSCVDAKMLLHCGMSAVHFHYAYYAYR